MVSQLSPLQPALGIINPPNELNENAHTAEHTRLFQRRTELAMSLR